MYKILALILLLLLMLKPSYAYLDTTPADFKKPEIIKVKPYKYRESKVRLHTEKAVGKLVPMMMVV